MTQSIGSGYSERVKRSSRGGSFLRRIGRRMPAKGYVAIAIVLVVAAAAISAPLLSAYDPNIQLPKSRLLTPSSAHWFGTDELGRDLFSRNLYGLRATLVVAFIAAIGGTAVGWVVGAVAGYVGGRLDSVAMRLIDTLLAFPPILLGILLLTVRGNSLDSVVLAIGVYNVPVFARIARAAVITEMSRDYVLAARAIGATGARILLREVLINTVPPMLVQLALSVSYGIILQASLEFLGLGSQPPNPSFGGLLNAGRGYMRSAMWYVMSPAITLSVIVIALNLLADAINQSIAAGVSRVRY